MVDWQDALCKPSRQIVREPGESVPRAGGHHPARRCRGEARAIESNADERAILVDRIKPRQNFSGRRRPLNLRQNVGVEEQVHGISSRRFVLLAFKLEVGAAQRRSQQKFGERAFARGLPCPFFGGNDHGVGPAVTSDDLRAGLGAVDHLGQACLGIGKRPRVGRLANSGAVLWSVMSNRTNMTIMTI